MQMHEGSWRIGLCGILSFHQTVLQGYRNNNSHNTLSSYSNNYNCASPITGVLTIPNRERFPQKQMSIRPR